MTGSFRFGRMGFDFSELHCRRMRYKLLMDSADEHVAQEVVECLREIENVYFMTEAEWNLYTELSF